ncbi:O-antigen ligase family protein [Flavobacterium sp.]|uniref:O-antigen ligase family protein n=1 Tax=Flavobacterium sp. TaxID=239 RepID=UPI003BEF03B6
MACGSFWGKSIIDLYSVNTFSHDLFAYLFTVITICFFWIANVKDSISIYIISKNYLYLLFWYLFICCFAVTQPNFTLLGFDFSYLFFRFSGLSENPNQLAGFLVGLPFLLFIFWNSFNSTIFKFLFFLEIIVIGIATFSDALVLSWVFGFVFLSIYFFIKFQPKLVKCKLLQILGILYKFLIVPLCIILISVYFFFQALDYADDVYNEGSQGSERLNRWEIGISALKSSPIFGFGPGSFSGITKPFEDEESHNSYIDFALSTGFVGLMAFVLLILYFSWALKKSPILLTAIFSTLIYIAFGFFLRHPFFWFNLLLYTEIATTLLYTKNSKNQLKYNFSIL